MSVALRWIVVASLAIGTELLDRRLLRAALRTAVPARRAQLRGETYDPGLARWGWALATGCAALAVVDGALAATPRFAPGIRDAGAGLFAAAAALLLWTDARLARLARAGEPPLLTDGPYALIRHPRYLAWLVGLVGVGLVADSPAGLGATGLMLAAVRRRIVREEAALATVYGAGWARYRAATWRLVPGVY